MTDHTDTPALVAWLLKQIGVVERIAEAALPDSKVFEDLGPNQPPADVHIEYWTPQRVLDDCLAKRQLVEIAAAQLKAADLYPDENWAGSTARATGALQAMALPHADRPGYREEWRP